jgi:hypothetical protein
MDKEDIKEFIKMQIKEELSGIKHEFADLKYTLEKILMLTKWIRNTGIVAFSVLSFLFTYAFTNPKEAIGQMKTDIASHTISIEKHQILIDDHEHRINRLEK